MAQKALEDSKTENMGILDQGMTELSYKMVASTLKQLCEEVKEEVAEVQIQEFDTASQLSNDKMVEDLVLELGKVCLEEAHAESCRINLGQFSESMELEYLDLEATIFKSTLNEFVEEL